jgi:serine-type D-Ala-D-Ala carboxypeptidase/endopeptidase (penicillin-binding protein 4)
MRSPVFLFAKISHEVPPGARVLLFSLTLCLAGVVAVFGVTQARSAPAFEIRHANLPAELKQVIATSGIDESYWGVAIVPIPLKLRDGQRLASFSLNPKTPMNPASVMKLVTTRTALDLLGPDYRHRTRLATTGTLLAGELSGDLYLQGGGDPKLVTEDLAEMVQRLRAIGVERIKGHFIVDGSRFNEPEIDPADFDRKPTSAYNVGPHAAMVNFKALRIFASVESGRRVAIETEPRIPKSQITSRVHLVTGGCEASKLKAQMNTKGNLLVSGPMGRRCSGVDFHVSVMDHAQFALTAFESAWRDAGGSMKVALRSGMTPDYARTLVDWKSPRPLIELVADMNKLSNNVMTRQLFLNLSASDLTPATREASAQRVTQHLSAQGLSFPELVMDNGSGLSRDERISAQSLALLLTRALMTPGGDDWVATLPRVGIEGTVRNRLRDAAVMGNAWMKTGTLRDVRALAGYVRSSEDRWVVLVAMVNHPDAPRAREAIDSMVKWAHAYRN